LINFQIQIYEITALIIYIYRSSMENCVESKSGPNERKCRARGGPYGKQKCGGVGHHSYKGLCTTQQAKIIKLVLLFQNCAAVSSNADGQLGTPHMM
jgi:hypothetical protein